MPIPIGFSEKSLGFSSRSCAKGSFRTVKPNKNTRVLVCCKKSDYSRKSKRCGSGLKGVKIMRRKL